MHFPIQDSELSYKASVQDLCRLQGKPCAHTVPGL